MHQPGSFVPQLPWKTRWPLPGPGHSFFRHAEPSAGPTASAAGSCAGGRLGTPRGVVGLPPRRRRQLPLDANRRRWPAAGRFLRRVDDRYTASVFPFLAGRSHGFGPHADAMLRGSVLDMICALHKSTSVVRTCAPRHVLRFAGREDLHAFLASPDRRWESGPFAEAARRLLVPHAAALAQLVMDFDRLVESTRRVRVHLVITHGEPHPANVMAVDGRHVLIDWDTVGLAPPERDVSLIVTADNEGIERYQQATGIALSPAVITLYRLRWYLDDLGSATRMFRNAHHDTPDTRLWRDGVSGHLDRLPEWRAALAWTHTAPGRPGLQASQAGQLRPGSPAGRSGTRRIGSGRP